MSDEYAQLLRNGIHVDVELRRRYSAGVAEVWEALTSPDRLARWLAPLSGDLHEGGRFRIDFDADDAAQQVHGTITECRAPRRLAVTWEIHGAGTSVAVATLTGSAEGCELLLEHRGLPEGMGAGYGAGWHAYGEALAAELAGDVAAPWDDRWAALLPQYRDRMGAAADRGTARPGR